MSSPMMMGQHISGILVDHGSTQEVQEVQCAKKMDGAC